MSRVIPIYHDMTPKDQQHEYSLHGYFCDRPFASFYIFEDGTVENCCRPLFKEPLGNLNDGVTIYDLMTSAKSKEFKKSILDGSFSYCNHHLCHRITNTVSGVGENADRLKKINPNLASMIVPANLKQFQPIVIVFGYDRSCNLRCTTCRSEVIFHKEVPEHLQRVHDQTMKSVHELLQKGFRVLINCTGTAEPFVSKLFTQFLTEFDYKAYPEGQIMLDIHSHGLTLNEERMNLPFIRDCLNRITVSIDGFNKDVYDKIRLGGNHQRLHDNLKVVNRVVGELKRDRRVVFDTNYTVMADNLADMVEYATQMPLLYDQLDMMSFNPILYADHMQQSWYLDQAVHFTTHHRYPELAAAVKALATNPKVQTNSISIVG